MGDLAGPLRSERHSLIGFLETLTPDEWTVPSLCSGWTVQDVAAHLAWSPTLRPLETVLGVARGGFRLNRVNEENARRWATRGPSAILVQLRTNAERGLRPPGTTELMALSDAVTHAVDIRRPLGRSGPMNPEAFPAVADGFAGLRWPLTISVGGGARRVTRGLRLVADDLDWSHGDGPEVRGSAEALLLVLARRPVGPDELSGPGAPELYARL